MIFYLKKKHLINISKVKSEAKYNKELLKYLSMWYGVSHSEVVDYLELLSKEEVIEILMKYG
jgi:hypothetical protein